MEEQCWVRGMERGEEMEIGGGGSWVGDVEVQ